jgi:hypothetical protein
MLSRGMKKFYVYSIIFGVVFILMLAPIVVPYYARDSAFSVFNDGPEGTSHFYKELMTRAPPESFTSNEEQFLSTIIGSLTTLPTDEAGSSVLLIMGPSRSYGGQELDTLETFVSSGGTIVIADDFGTGNEVLDGVGIEERFAGTLLRDLVYEDASSLPLAYAGATNVLYLNNATAILNASTTILTSSPLSFLDEDENAARDGDEALQSHTIAAKTHVGEGVVYLISDPSILTNDGLGREGNGAFALSILERASEGFERTIYINEAHVGARGGLEAIELVIEAPNAPFLRWALVAVLAAVLIIEGGVIGKLSRAFDRLLRRLLGDEKKHIKNLDQEELITHLRQRHPEWSSRGLNAFFSKFK